MSQNLGELITDKKPEPFYFKQGAIPTKEEILRIELMGDLNKWAHNDEYIAKQKAMILIDVLEKQFGIERSLNESVIYSGLPLPNVSIGGMLKNQ